MADGGRQAAARAHGDVGEEDAHHDAETAHGEDAQHGPAGIARAVVMPDGGERRMPKAPDHARDQQCRHNAQLGGHLRHEVAAPAPFLAERREDVERGRHEHGERQLRDQRQAQHVRGHLGSSGHLCLLLHGGQHERHRGVEVLRERKEVHGCSRKGQHRGREPGHEEPRQRLFESMRLDQAVLEPFPRDEARDRHADGGEEHGGSGCELRCDRRDARKGPRRDGIHHPELVRPC